MSWQLDLSHSHIQFTVRHMMVSKVRGRFETFTATVEADEQNPANSTIAVQIDAASINSKDPKRDGHLKSPDFLDVENYPYITFKSSQLTLSDETNGQLHGDLTIRDVTKEVVLDVEYGGQIDTQWGSTHAGFSAQTKINRKEWGLNWNVAIEAGGWLVSDELTIDIELELIKQIAQPEQVEAVSV